MTKGKQFEHKKGVKSPMEKSVELQTCANCGTLFEIGDNPCPNCGVSPSLYARRFEKYRRSE